MNKKVSIIVGRFQTPILSDRHIDLIKKGLEIGDELVILLGCPKIGIDSRIEVSGDEENPFSYEYRKELIEYQFQNYSDKISFSYIDDCDTDEIWSNRLDSTIDLLNLYDDNLDYVLVGTKNSYLDIYSGKNKSILVPESISMSSKDIRSKYLNIVD